VAEASNKLKNQFKTMVCVIINHQEKLFYILELNAEQYSERFGSPIKSSLSAMSYWQD
jgi:hypothetical protein